MRRKNSDVVTALIIGGLILGSSPALAETFTPGLDGRTDHQQERIHEGVRAGQLTPGEFNRLQREQARIRAAEARLRADGRLDPRERARLNAMLNRSSRDIYRAEHNRQVAAPGRAWGQPHPYWGARPGIPWRQANQHNRIYQGVRSGQVAPAEFKRWGNQQARLRGAEARMRVDGNFTPRGQGGLNPMVKQGAPNFYRARHNNRVGR